jgi:signal transduction histidine kinase
MTNDAKPPSDPVRAGRPPSRNARWRPVLRLRLIQFAALILISAVPVLILDGWVQRSALEKEIASVAEKHLIIAQNMSAALSRYATDVKEGFRAAVSQSGAGGSTVHLNSMLRTLGFDHACIIDSDGKPQIFLFWPQDFSKAKTTSVSAPILATLRKIARAAGGEVVITDIIRDGGIPRMYLLQQVGPTDFALGVLGLDYIRGIQRSISFGQRGHSMIVDSKGTVMAHPNRDWERNFKDASGLPVVRKMMQGITGVTTFYSPPMKADMIAGHTSVPETGWGVMVPQPLAELTARAKDTQNIAIAITLAGILIASIIGWWLTRYMTEPIIAVEQAAGAVAAGRLDTRVGPLPKYSPIEMRSLAASFDHMTEELRLRDEGLRVATHQAEAANVAKSEFLANMSHELRTPLNAILGFSEILERQTYGPLGSERYLEYARDIRISGEHLLDLINDVLDVARIEAGAMKPMLVEVEIPSIIESCLTMTENRAHSGEISVQSDIPEDFPLLRVDERMTRQILINLLSNALKFTPSGGSVTVSATLDADGGATLQVVDTGIGIAQEHLELVIQPFKQVENAMQRSYDGSGLGLYLTKTMAELQGASMEIRSEMGRGTTVAIHYPAEATVRN